MSTPAEPLTTVAGDNDLVFTAAYQHLPRSDTRRDKCLTSLIQVCFKPSPMQLAPGPLYLLQNLPFFAVPSTIVYACLTLAKEHLSLAVPTWLTVFIAVLARPAIFIFNRHYSWFADNRDAAANNAVVAPHVRGTALSLISKLARARNGYPGLILACTSVPVRN